MDALSVAEKKFTNFIKGNRNNNVPIILVGNNFYNEENKIKYEEGKAIADKYHWNFFEVSAFTGEGVEEAFEDIIYQSYLYQKSLQIQISTLKNNNNKPKTSLFANIFKKKDNITENKKDNNKKNSIETPIIAYSKEISIEHLKNMITKIEKEKDLNQLYLKLLEIEKTLKEMKPITCDISNQIITHSLF